MNILPLCPQQILLVMMGVSMILRELYFSRIFDIYQGFRIKHVSYSKILNLGGSGAVVCTFSEIRKMIFP